jgi:hypothetical protein
VVDGVSEETAAHAARQIKGATIAWGGGEYFDLANPNPEVVTIEDVAYALAYTVRWRGQARSFGRRVFYGVAEHCVIGAKHVLRETNSKAHALAFLFHEDDEIVFPDIPGPAKLLLSDDCKAAIRRCGEAIRLEFGVGIPDPDLIKRYDIRMLLTERRDLLGKAFANDEWHNGGSGGTASCVGFEPFDEQIRPTPHPSDAALQWLEMYHWLRA